MNLFAAEGTLSFPRDGGGQVHLPNLKLLDLEPNFGLERLSIKVIRHNYNNLQVRKGLAQAENHPCDRSTQEGWSCSYRVISRSCSSVSPMSSNPSSRQYR